MRSPAWPLLAVCLIAIPAYAQSAKPAPAGVVELEKRVTALEADVQELKKGAVEGSQAAQAVSDLAAQLAVVKQQVDALGKQGEAGAAVTAKLDALEARLADLRDDVAALRAQTHAETAPETRGPAAASGAYSDGFVLVNTADGRFTLRAKGYVQLRYLADASETLDDLRESGFQLRRARLWWTGNVWSPSLSYGVQLGLERAELFDYYVDGKVLPWLSIRGGRFKVPFARDWLVPGDKLSFVERPVATEEFRYDHDLGVAATLSFGRVEATAGVWNGASRNSQKNDNKDPLLVARVTATVLGKPWKPEEGDFDHLERPALQIGVAGSFENAPVPDTYVYANPDVEQFTGTQFNTDVNDDGERDNVRVIQGEVDLAFRWKGLGVEAEGYARREEWGLIGQGQSPAFTPDDTYLGAYAQATYFLVPQRYQVGVRGSWTEVSPVGVGGHLKDFAKNPPVSDVRKELSVIAAYYRERHGIELTGMWSFLDWGTEDGPSPQGVGEQRFIVEAQVGF